MPRDPVEAGATDDTDLYDISTWEARTRLDRVAVRIHRGLLTITRGLIVGFAVLIIVGQFLLGGMGVLYSNRPAAAVLVVLSVLPALALFGYVYRADVTTSEPLVLIVGTFGLGVLFAGFAALVNSALRPLLAVPLVGGVLFFYLVVGPVEEAVKLLAVRLLPYRSVSFNAVVDGAVYGAAAGLGFATIENALYIAQGLTMGGAAPTETGVAALLGSGGGIAALRAFAGPGHVIYSAFAGYYLGLAKFNPSNAGPIVVKGLTIAALIHATYNTLVGPLAVLVQSLLGLSTLVSFFAVVILYDLAVGLVLYRKLRRYASAYQATRPPAPDRDGLTPELTEFDG